MKTKDKVYLLLMMVLSFFVGYSFAINVVVPHD